MLKITKRLSLILMLACIGIYAEASGADFTLNRVFPRILVPENGSRIEFEFSPGFYEVTVRIFDINGSQIRKNLERAESSNKMYWDGRDCSDNIVSGGIYIYQVEANGQVFNGTVIVAK